MPDTMEEKFKIANEIVKKEVKKIYKKGFWIYDDFVTDDRFLTEIKDETEIDINSSSSKELAEFALNKITKSFFS